LRQTQSPCYNRSFNFDDNKKFTGKKAHPHKSSFQFGNNKYSNNRTEKDRTDRFNNHNKSFEDEHGENRSFTHSKSIRIELEQKVDNGKNKKRKDSYKVKITTFQEYEMEDVNPEDFFKQAREREQSQSEFNHKN
jgi:hypothetical protein